MARILTLDDEPEYGELLSRILEADGHEVRSASRVDEGQVLTRDWAPECLIVDLMLRDERSGVEVARELALRFPEMKTIVISGYPSATAELGAEGLKVAGFLQKPFTPGALRDALRAAGY